MMSKTPAPGFSKTRLLEALTPEECAEFHRKCIADLAAVIRSLQLPLYIYYVNAASDIENQEEFLAAWGLTSELSQNIRFRLQQGNDLGQKMLNAVRETLVDYPAMIVIGSDLPDLSFDQFQEACTNLEQADLVIGPCYDGGYYLMGLKEAHSFLFEEIPWSTPQVLECTLSKAEQSGLNVQLLDTCRDIDNWTDMSDFYRRNKGQSSLQSFSYAEHLIKKYAVAAQTDNSQDFGPSKKEAVRRSNLEEKLLE